MKPPTLNSDHQTITGGQVPAAAGQRSLFDLSGRLVLVVGFGESGLAMARWLDHCGARVRVAETRTSEAQKTAARAAHSQWLPNAELIFGELQVGLLDGVELVTWSPGLSVEVGPFVSFYQMVRERGITLAGEIELFAQALAQLSEQGYRPRLAAITGTNGKTTTTALVAHLCQHAGLKVRAAGNISPAALDALREAVIQNDLPDVWVLELSSFQLMLTESLRSDSAAILNITQDHLDWHQSMDTYCQAKHRIFTNTVCAVFNRDDPLTKPRAAQATTSFGLGAPGAVGEFGVIEEGGLDWLAQAVVDEDAPPRRRGSKGPVPFCVKRLMPADALKIRGAHNRANALAALTMLQAMNVPLSRSLHGLRSYEGEPHRCQWVANIAAVDFFDDSKGTNVGATVAALGGLGRHCVLIAGGEGKGQDFSPLAVAVRNHARAVVLIGRDAALIGQALADSGVPLLYADSMEQAVRLAAEAARAADAVLMSPACASFDMFRNYEHRAEVFVAAVRSLGLELGVVQ